MDRSVDLHRVFRVFECTCAVVYNLTQSFLLVLRASRCHRDYTGADGGEHREIATGPLTTRGEFIRSPVVSLFMKSWKSDGREGRGWTEIESSRDPVGPELIKTSGIMRAGGIARNFAGRKVSR